MNCIAAALYEMIENCREPYRDVHVVSKYGQPTETPRSPVGAPVWGKTSASSAVQAPARVEVAIG
jgi:hypothetical protein